MAKNIKSALPQITWQKMRASMADFGIIAHMKHDSHMKYVYQSMWKIINLACKSY